MRGAEARAAGDGSPWMGCKRAAGPMMGDDEVGGQVAKKRRAEPSAGDTSKWEDKKLLSTSLADFQARLFADSLSAAAKKKAQGHLQQERKAHIAEDRISLAVREWERTLRDKEERETAFIKERAKSERLVSQLVELCEGSQRELNNLNVSVQETAAQTARLLSAQQEERIQLRRAFESADAQSRELREAIAAEKLEKEQAQKVTGDFKAQLAVHAASLGDKAGRLQGEGERVKVLLTEGVDLIKHLEGKLQVTENGNRVLLSFLYEAWARKDKLGDDLLERKAAMERSQFAAEDRCEQIRRQLQRTERQNEVLHEEIQSMKTTERPKPKYGVTTDVIQWWASWFATAKVPLKQIAKKTRPKWYVGRINSPAVWKDNVIGKPLRS